MSEEITVKVHSYGPSRPLSLVYFDPISGKKKAKSSGTTNWREAERLAGELEKELRSGRYKPKSKITFEEARERFQEEHLAGLDKDSASPYNVALNHLDRVLSPNRLSRVTTDAIGRFKTTLRAQGMKETTLATHLRHIKAFLNWAERMGLMVSAPQVEMPKKAKGQTMMKGRPITTEEFDRIILAVPKVRPDDAPAWTRYLTGLWLSGLRLEESTVLSWDIDAPFSVDLTGRRPAFRIYAEAQKAKRDEMLPMTPDFAEWLLQTPEAERTGPVFKLPMQDGRQMHARLVGKIVTKIGEKAGAVVNKAEHKFASAHDLRRAFGTRWAKRVMPAILQRLMRHASIQTTMAYYVSLNSDEVADDLWATFGPKTGVIGNTSGNNCPETQVDGNAGDGLKSKQDNEMRTKGFEPLPLTGQDPKSCVSANSTTSAKRPSP